MSPAGYWPQLQAAIEAGADAVYFGLKQFTARAKVGFSPEELPEVFRTLHRRGVRGFVTFNTLVFDDELSEAARALESIAAAGADAVIVQDVGVLALVQQVAPDLEIHASTQMSVTDARGAQLAVEWGVHRVTLARELSLDEIAEIARQTEVELECFVHGALCVAYSGQCFSSEAWGGRSANRGQCAQACRLPYDLIVDGRQRPLGDARYLLSPGDLYALEQVPRLVEIGVGALKIEGRYKEAEYVAATTRAYREAVDAAWAGLARPVTEDQRLRLEQVYSRGLGPYFITGTNHQNVVKGRDTRHRGVLMGRVVRVHEDARIEIEPAPAHQTLPLQPGDGVVFDAGDWRNAEQREEGGRVYSVTGTRPDRLELAFGNRDLNPARVQPGDLVWRTHSPQLEKELRVYTQATAPVRRQPVTVRVVAREGERLRTEWSTARCAIVAESAEVLTRAHNQPPAEESVRRQLERLGGTPYELAQLSLAVEGAPFLPASLLNQVRRQAVELLQAAAVRQPTARQRDTHLPPGSASGPATGEPAPCATPTAPGERRQATSPPGAGGNSRDIPPGGLDSECGATECGSTDSNEGQPARSPELLAPAIPARSAETRRSAHSLDPPALDPSASGFNQVEETGAREGFSSTAAPADPFMPVPPGAVARDRAAASPTKVGTGSQVHLLVRTPEQLDAALALRPASITLDYLDLYGLKPSLERVRQAGLAVRVASPRVLKPGEEKIADFLYRLDVPLLVRPAGLLAHLPDRRLTGDFSLNAANALSARRFLAMGLERLTPAHDLNGDQIARLAREVGGERLEAIVYQHLPVFHTEHCVFCRFLSTGTTFRDCGRPCEHHRVELRDTSGRTHPVLADIGCRNTVFGAEAQEASAFLAAWRGAGIRHFRLEFAHESAEQVKRVVEAFGRALAGSLTPRGLQMEWRLAAPQSVTQGSLFVPVSAIRPAGVSG